MQFIYEYGLFLLQAITIVGAILFAVGGMVGIAQKQRHRRGELEITSLSERFDDVVNTTQEVLLNKSALKQLRKEQKKTQKAKDKDRDEQDRLFVVDFKGSMEAKEVDNLREEITAILCVAKPEDEVLVRLESGGGVVHGYGLGASQLQRVKDKGIKLTVAVDKVAASGGYMMAAVADRIISAPFAIIGSIGVLGQLPNFHRLLEKNNIDFEQHTAGEYKRTLTVFGKNDDAGREKFREELEQVHGLFKNFVAERRTDVNIDEVATGEYWYGLQAKERQLVDDITTSDDYLFQANDAKRIYKVHYATKKNLADKFGHAASVGVDAVTNKLWQKSRHPIG